MSWRDLINHPYITQPPESSEENNQIHLSYTEATGHYQVEEQKLDDSSLIQRDPYNNLNSRNAIMLNCKDPMLYQDIYKKTVERHQKRSRMTDQSFEQFEEPEIDIDNPMIQTLLGLKKETPNSNNNKNPQKHKEEIVGVMESKEEQKQGETGPFFNANEANGLGLIDIDSLTDIMQKKEEMKKY